MRISNEKGKRQFVASGFHFQSISLSLTFYVMMEQDMKANMKNKKTGKSTKHGHQTSISVCVCESSPSTIRDDRTQDRREWNHTRQSTTRPKVIKNMKEHETWPLNKHIFVLCVKDEHHPFVKIELKIGGNGSIHKTNHNMATSDNISFLIIIIIVVIPFPLSLYLSLKISIQYMVPCRWGNSMKYPKTPALMATWNTGFTRPGATYVAW